MRTFVDVMAAPTGAIETIRNRGRAWFPIAAKVLAAVVFWVWYFQVIDLEWFKEQVVFAGNKIPPEARATVDELMTTKVLTVSSLISDLVIMTLVLVVMTTYLWVIGRDVRGTRPKLRQWAALVSWASVPTFLVTLATALLVYLRNGTVLPTDIDPTSFNSLFIGAGPTSEWALWATSFSVVHLWTLGIVTLGFRQWTGRSWSTSAAVVCAPVVIGYAFWAFQIAH